MATAKASDSSATCPYAGDLSNLTATVNEIKSTLGRLAEVLASNAVLEEKSTQFRKEINDIYRRLHMVEITVATYSGSSHWVERVIWLLISSALGGMLVARIGG